MEYPYSWLYWIGEYMQWARSIFGVDLPPQLASERFKCSASFDPTSKYGQVALKGLLEAELLYCEDLLISIRENNVSGALVEFGVYKGDWINRLVELNSRLGLKRKIWGFDSFEGLSDPDPRFDNAYWKPGMFSASLEDVEKYVRVSERPEIKLVKGWFNESLHGSDAQGLEEVAFARIDCDIYEPSLECLRFLSSRLSHGAVLVFDDWSHRLDTGETRAFLDWVSEVSTLEFEFLFYGAWDHFYIRVWHRGKLRH